MSTPPSGGVFCLTGRRHRHGAEPMARTYLETFDDGPGGWFGFASNALGPKPLEVCDGAAVSRSPWWIDYNHAPPGAGYLHLLYLLLTKGAPGEYQREVSGPNRFIAGGF